MKNNTIFQRYSIVCYFVLVFVISWGGAYLFGAARILQGEILSFNEVMAMGLIILGGPFLAGIVMSLLVDGREGLRDIVARLKAWRVGGRWYAAVLIFPGFILAVCYILGLIVSPDLYPNFFATGIVIGLMAGFLEEVGWTGFVYPKMRLKMSALTAGLILGFIHAVWHILGDYIGNGATFGDQWLPYFAGFFVFVVALRVIIVWVYENTKSLLLAMLMHASSTGFLAILLPIGINPKYWVVFYLVYVVALWAVAAVIIKLYGKNLVREPAKLS